MKNKSIVLVLLICILLGSITYIAYRTSQIPQKQIHYHANFAVFLQDKQQNFTNPSFMHLKPCYGDEDTISLNKLDNVHLHDQIGNVVHVHQKGITWNDLFTSIKYNIQKDIQQTKGTAHYFLNTQKEDSSILAKEIQPQDRLLVSVSDQPDIQNTNNSTYYTAQMQSVGNNAKDYDDGKIGIEHCGATGTRSYTTRLRIALKQIFKAK